MIQTSTVSDKYQVVIPALIRRTMGVKRGQQMSWVIPYGSYMPVAMVGPEKVDWAKRLAGLGKGNWSGIDAQKYIDDFRNEWEK